MCRAILGDDQKMIVKIEVNNGRKAVRLKWRFLINSRVVIESLLIHSASLWVFKTLQAAQLNHLQNGCSGKFYSPLFVCITTGNLYSGVFSAKGHWKICITWEILILSVRVSDLDCGNISSVLGFSYICFWAAKFRRIERAEERKLKINQTKVSLACSSSIRNSELSSAATNWSTCATLRGKHYTIAPCSPSAHTPMFCQMVLFKIYIYFFFEMVIAIQEV